MSDPFLSFFLSFFLFAPFSELATNLRDMLSEMENPLSIQNGLTLDELALFFSKSVTKKKKQLLQHFGEKNSDILFGNAGFRLDVQPSSIEGAGTGVFVREGHVSPGQIVALYPGTVYQPYHPVL